MVLHVLWAGMGVGGCTSGRATAALSLSERTSDSALSGSSMWQQFCTRLCCPSLELTRKGAAQHSRVKHGPSSGVQCRESLSACNQQLQERRLVACSGAGCGAMLRCLMGTTAALTDVLHGIC